MRTPQIIIALAALMLGLVFTPAASATDSSPTSASSPSGHRAAPRDLRYLSGFGAPQKTRALKAHPAAYDLRQLDRVSPVEDQRPFGTCWAFAALGSLESGLLSSGPTVWDFSEDHLVWRAGFAFADRYNAGGNSFMALAYLSRWGGPVNEGDDPYADGAHPAGLVAQRHLSDAVFVPPRTFGADPATGNDALKSAVMAYGAVDVDMWWPTSNLTSYWNEGTDSIYTYGDHPANHDVLVVGWDDMYAASNFATEPPGPGAFIVKNSWGTAFGASGFFHVSYYDTTFACGGYNIAFVDADVPYDHVRVYQHDPKGYWPQDGPVASGTTAWGANVFTAAANEDLTAAGLYTPYPGCAYEVLYKASGGKPSFAALRTVASGTAADPGYHVVTLPEAVALNAGERFTIAVKLVVPPPPDPDDPFYFRYLPVERPYPGYSDATADPGQSYVCTNGSTWRDLTSLYAFAEANVCLKAFTTGVPWGTLKVNGGAAYARSAAVTLRAKVSGAAEMRLREAGGAWSAWQPFAATPDWTLSDGDGKKTVEAEFRNDCGTALRADAIFLDTHRPRTRAPFKRSVRRFGHVRLAYRVEDKLPCAARVTVTVKIRTLTGATKRTFTLGKQPVNALRSYGFRCTLPKRMYRYYVYATDAAGNTQRVVGRNYLYVR